MGGAKGCVRWLHRESHRMTDRPSASKVPSLSPASSSAVAHLMMALVRVGAVNPPRRLTMAPSMPRASPCVLESMRSNSWNVTKFEPFFLGGDGGRGAAGIGVIKRTAESSAAAALAPL